MLDDNDINQKINFEIYKNLRDLRDVIYNKELFTIIELRKKIKFYPGKYLSIFGNKAIDINSSNNKEIQTFQLKYSNNFFKLTVNEILKNLESELEFTNKNVIGSGAGISFESKVINSILNNTEQVFEQLKYEKRRVFSLVGKTKSSKDNIDKHRNREKNNNLYNFYNIKEYSEKIDDIDYGKGSNEIKLKKNLYLITQVSKTGRSFDFTILYKSKNSDEWFLFIFQASINKTSELKSKHIYLSDAFICESYLGFLYDIKIAKTFFLFVIPKDTSEISFIRDLESRAIHYIYYKSRQFYDKDGFIISTLNFQEGELTKDIRRKIDKNQVEIERALNAWENSVNQFIRRKRKTDKLSKYYLKNLKIIKSQEIKLILSSEIKGKIFDAIYGNIEHENELLFVGNCKFKNIEDIVKKNNLLIFFKINDEFYFYFEFFYKYDGDSFVKINALPKKKIKCQFNYTKLNIALSEIDEKSDLCFCYRILG